jgi:hypothetical protein
MKTSAWASLSDTIVVCLAVLLSIAGKSAATDVIWDDQAGDGNWNTAANWDPNTVPGTATGQYARIRMTTGPVFNGQTASVYRIYLENAANGTLTMNSGSLAVLNHVYVADVSTARGTLNMNGGAISISGTLYIGRDNGSVGTVNLSGGTISCHILSMGTNTGAGVRINITGSGKLIIDGDVSATIATWIATRWIKAYDGSGTVIVDTTSIAGKTVLTALISYKATIPRPTCGATGMLSSGTALSWTPGVGAASHDIYLGTDLADVNNARRLAGDLDGSSSVDWDDVASLTGYWLMDPAATEPYAGIDDDHAVDFFDYALLAKNWRSKAGPEFEGNQDVNSFDPGTLAFDTTYYWRIDEVSGPNTTKGEVWSFTVNSGKASALAPANGTSNVLSRAVLAWTPDPAAVSHDVYFGTTNPPPFIGNQTVAIYNPGGSMASSTAFYWRIDEKYSVGTVQGDTWSFTTMDQVNEPDFVFVQASDPEMGWNHCIPSTDYLWGVTVSKVNNLNADFMLVTGDLVSNDSFVATYKSYKAALNPAIECFEVPGNTDLGGTGSPSAYAAWASNYGYGPNPWYSFVYENSLFIGLDSLVLITPFDGKDVEEIDWLTHTLADADANGVNHKFVFMHHPLFLRDVNEPANIAFSAERRAQLRTIFQTYNVDAVFSGHYHTSGCVFDGNLQYIATPACTCSYGPAAIRVIKVYSDRIEHEVRNLDSLP